MGVMVRKLGRGRKELGSCGARGALEVVICGRK